MAAVSVKRSILPTPLMFISGFANTKNVFYCLIAVRNVHFEFRCKFQILNVVVVTLYIEHNGQASVLLYCTNGHLFALEEPKIVFGEVQKEDVLHAFVLK